VLLSELFSLICPELISGTVFGSVPLSVNDTVTDSPAPKSEALNTFEYAVVPVLLFNVSQALDNADAGDELAPIPNIDNVEKRIVRNSNPRNDFKKNDFFAQKAAAVLAIISLGFPSNMRLLSCDHAASQTLKLVRPFLTGRNWNGLERFGTERVL
jgi:hypothetical protein